MRSHSWNVRNIAVGAVLILGLGIGTAACGSSSASPSTQNNTGGSTAPTQTVPPTTAPSGGSVSY